LDLADRFERSPLEAVQVTKRGRRVMTLLPAELWDAMVETLEVLSEPDSAVALRKALTELDEGKAVPWTKARGALLR
jgi:PHD/YefM family antitoxin component YafN of YafNO toxin-antitoxin module